jgi:hypothetical protein
LQFKASPGSNLSWKKISIKKRAGGVAQGVGPEFKSQYHKKKKKECFTPPSGILLQATNAHVSEAGEDSCGQANRLGGPPSSVRGSLNFKDVGEK